MSNLIQVYYSDEHPGSVVTPIMQLKPEKALTQMDLPDIKSSPKAGIRRCPAFVEYYKNCFVYRSPIDITLTYHSCGHMTWTTSLSSQQHAERLVEVRDDFGMFSLGLYVNTWCDESLYMEQIPLNLMRSNPVSDNFETMVAGFDISKWYRPLQPAFRFRSLEPEQVVIIKRGDPLYLIRFVTDKKVVLNTYTPSNKLLKISEQIDSVKSSNSGFFTSLENYYALYKHRKIHSQIKKEILTNLT